MKKIAALLMGVLLLVGFFAQAQPALPYLKNHQLWVNDRPFLMIGGELHNSSASSVEYMEQVWPKLKGLHLNTVLASVSWDQFEPVEGQFDYRLVDYLIEQSEKNNLKLVVIWFASWKNGQSSYAPLWVKRDTKRFPRVLDKQGRPIETLSVFAEATKNADATAFAALMRRIAERDKNRTVIMVQPENEVGIFQDMDYSPTALQQYQQPVPSALMDYLSANRPQLNQAVRDVWAANGYQKKGTWGEVFGNTPQAKECFMAWHYARYIDAVARAGRKAHNLPMFVNAWIVQKPDDLPGVYPNGGPVSRVMDIYKAGAPAIDVVCPDIYLPNYQDIYAQYYRKADNPLLVPESSLDPARAFFAFAEYDAIGFSPFGIEDAAGDRLFSASYGVLNELHDVVATHQRTGKMRGIHLTKDRQDQVFTIEGVEVAVKIQDPESPAFGLIVKTGADEFLVSGMNFKVTFAQPSANLITYIGQVVEGRYEKGNWVPVRWLNGDETYHHELLRVMGREVEIGKQFEFRETDLQVGQGEQFVYSPGGARKMMTPGIYQVKLYQRPKQ